MGCTVRTVYNCPACVVLLEISSFLCLLLSLMFMIQSRPNHHWLHTYVIKLVPISMHAALTNMRVLFGKYDRFCSFSCLLCGNGMSYISTYIYPNPLEQGCIKFFGCGPTRQSGLSWRSTQYYIHLYHMELNTTPYTITDLHHFLIILN